MVSAEMGQVTPLGMIKVVAARSSHSNAELQSRLLILDIPFIESRSGSYSILIRTEVPWWLALFLMEA